MWDSVRTNAAIAGRSCLVRRDALATIAAIVGWTIAFPAMRAEAACSVAGLTLTCAQDTTTANTTNTTSPNPVTSDRNQVFGGGFGVTAQINSGVTVDGLGFLLSATPSVAVTNNGTIKTNSTLSPLVLEAGAGASFSVNNTGTIQSDGFGTALFIDALGGGGTATINNSGAIIGGINLLGTSATITNSGQITQTTVAIFFDGFNNTLTLLPGSVIKGNVLGTGADTLQLGGAFGSDTFDLTNIGNTQQYSGFSTFNKIDNSTWTLTGTDATNSPWTVQGGTLLVDGKTGGLVTVQSGATLGGNGSVGPTGIGTGGTLMPGHNGLGTLTVNGNLLFGAGSAYQISVNGASAGFTSVTGTASLNNALAFVAFQGSTFSSKYTILSAASVSGTFSSLFTNSSIITANLSYDNNNVFLNLTSNIGGGGGNPPPGGGNPPPGGGVVPGLTHNQQAVANALDKACNIGGTCLAGIVNVPAAQIPKALDALSGEGISGTQQTAFAASDAFLSMMMDQGAFWRSEGRADLNGVTYGGPLGYAAESSAPAPFNAMAMATKAPVLSFAPRWRGWTAGFDGSNLVRGEAFPGSADQRQRIAGGTAGIDYQYSPNVLLGAAAGGSASSFSASDRLTSGSLDGAHLGTYGVVRVAPWYVAGALQYAHFDNRTSRTILGVGPTETASGRFGSDLASGRLEAGWRFAFQNVAVTPFGAVQFAELRQRGFTETSIGPNGTVGVNALSFAARNVSSFPTFLGAQLDARYALANGMIFSPLARLSWVHEFDPSRSVTASFLALTDSLFTVDGPRAARDAARIDFGSQLALNAGTSLFANFDGEFSSRSQAYAGKGGLKVYW